MKPASIEVIKDVKSHPNADKLDIVTVLSYQAIVVKDAWKTGDLCIFIQPDTVLPAEPWSEFYRAKSNRVKACKLRKVWSMGIVEELSIITKDRMDAEGHDLIPGYEVSGILGITKYEPPEPQDLNAKGNLPSFVLKSDEERWQTILDLPYNELVDVSLKIDGKSMAVYYKDGVAGVCGRMLDYKLDCHNHIIDTAMQYKLIEKLAEYCIAKKRNLVLRGELWGPGIQASQPNPHGKAGMSPTGKPVFSLYGIQDADTLQYYGKDSEHYYDTVAKELDLPCVRMLERNVVLTPELIKKYDEDLELIDGQPFEGVVIKLKDSSFKIINKHYDSKK